MAEQEGQYTRQKFGNYRLSKLLGIGGFAEVYLAEHIYLETQAAVKVLTIKLTEDEIKRFRNEAKMLIDLEHPNIAKVLDFGVENGIPYIVMRYAPNGTLRKHHPQGTRIPLPTVVAYVKQVATALQHIHDEYKLIHRDIKPENMLVGKKNEILLSDFGVAIVTHSTRSRSLQQALGTAIYMAPEHFQAKAELASDQYSLAIVVYEWLTGEPPFQGDILQLAYHHGYVAPPPLRNKVPDLPIKAEDVVLKALAKDPKQRYKSIREFMMALEEASTQPNRGTLLCIYKGHYGSINTLAWSPDNKFIASGCNAEEYHNGKDKAMVHVWNSLTGKRIFTCHNHDNSESIFEVIWISDRDIMYSWTFRDDMYLWMQKSPHDFIRAYNIIKRWEIFKIICDFDKHRHMISALIAPDKKTFARLDEQGHLQIYPFNPEELSQYVKYHNNISSKRTTTWSQDGKVLVYEQGNYIEIIDTQKKRTITKYHISSTIFQIVWSPDSKAIAFINHTDAALYIYKFLEDIPQQILSLDIEQTRGSLSWSTHSLHLAFIRDNEYIQVWDIFSKEASIFTFDDYPTRIYWSPDGSRIACVGYDNTIGVWQVA